MVSITPRPRFIFEKGLRYPFDKRLGEPESRSGLRGWKKNPLRPPPPMSGIEPPSTSPQLVTVLIELSRGVFIGVRNELLNSNFICCLAPKFLCELKLMDRHSILKVPQVDFDSKFVKHLKHTNYVNVNIDC